ncbi:DUF1592 domain-containing protein [Oleiharenicola lentus]|uniref:DUF1592 domain-containing protein n=1 Tax=Oleiharenicola lentus TaxID=2508720 RepID=UPI0013E94E11|nr:DUF1592 domain-containing protein [Oleiharenicola lentus]
MNPRSAHALLAGLLLSVCLPAAAGANAPSTPDPLAYSQVIQPFLDNYCFDCHNTDTRKGDINLEDLVDVGRADHDGRRIWELVHRQLRAGAMPPDREDQPTPEERAEVVSHLRQRLTHIDLSKPVDSGRVTARRFNRTEYDNTIHDLFGIRLSVANTFPGDDVGYGFDNIGDVHSVSPLRLQLFLEAAETVSDFLLNTGRRLEMNRNEQGVFFDRIKVVKSSDAGVVLDQKGWMSVEYETPLPGTYELSIRAWGLMPDSVFKARQIDELNGWPQFPNAFQPGDSEPIVPLEVWVDGQLVDTLHIAQGLSSTDWKTYTTNRFPLGMGPHQVTFKLGTPATLTGEARDAWIADPPRLGVKEARMTGPHAVDRSALSPLHRRLIEIRPGPDRPPAAAAREILAELLPRAFRRPAAPGEIESFVGLMESLLANGESFESALDGALQAILVSPHFLYRLELGPDATAPDRIRPVGDYALASRLSYFLWNSMPDDTLFALAAEGRLDNDDVLRAQVARLLADPRAVAFKEGFFRQWLDLRKLRTLSIDKARFPVFTEDLRADVEQETLLFIGSIIAENRSVQDLLRADHTFVNDALAELYGLPLAEAEKKEKDRSFRRVSLEGLPRRGLLTQPSILMLTSYPNRTSPTKRGNWILEAILGDEPPPPPANVPQLEEAVANSAALPLREQLELHRTNQTCASCHATMDPIGLGLENFDAIGRWRTTDAGAPINASGVLPDGNKFDGPLELLGLLQERDEDFVRCFTQKLLTFALGRGLEFYDRVAVDEILARTQAGDHRILDIVTEAVLSRPFRLTRGDPVHPPLTATHP